AEAQAEARILMLSSNNILSPASGRPITAPTKDMVLGLFHVTSAREKKTGEGRVFSSVAEAIMAYDQRSLDVQAVVRIRLDDVPSVDNGWDKPDWEAPVDWTPSSPLLVETTLGRVFFNETLPVDYRFVNYDVRKQELSEIINDLAERYPKVQVAATLDALKETGFHWATRSGVTIGIQDVVTPPSKAAIMERYEADADKIEKQHQRGVITNEERRQELIDIWTKATNEVSKAVEENFPITNPVWAMVKSGARGNAIQVRQLAGMRGLVANPKGETIPRPIKSSLREGLSVLEYFISTHGARKGLADTALRTADSGYLTRRLVDVSQDVIIRDDNCQTTRGVSMIIAAETEDGRLIKDPHVETSGYARTLASDVVSPDGVVVVPAGADLGDVLIDTLVKAGISQIKVRSVLTCESATGVCAGCYGRSLASGKLVDVGEAVGIVAAQSIGEPGTQLTMRTFHMGGVAGEDITQGMPRVVELFEARVPKGKAPIAETAGRIRIEETDKARKIVIVPDDGSEERAYPVSKRSVLMVTEGEHVEVGQKLVKGAANPHEVLRILGQRKVHEHLVDEVQEVYRSQGVSIHDKHIE
ncbi:MAG: DNA-directed RNA polymerase subunit beta', partial [Mycobacteriales bacterium]